MDSQPGPSRIKDDSPERPQKKYKTENVDFALAESKGYKGSKTIDDLPDEIVVHILSYLSVPDRILNAQKVCCKWHQLVKWDVLWRYVKLSDISESLFIKILVSLPPCVLHFECDSKKSNLLLPISLLQLMAKLHERCPHLKTLILQNIMLVSRDNFSEMFLLTAKNMLEKPVSGIIESKFLKEENIRMADTSLPEVKILSCNRISFGRFFFHSHLVNCVFPKITVLDLSHSQPLLREVIANESFSTLVDLEELYLEGWSIRDENILGFLKYLKKLRILDLNYCLLNDKAISTLVQYGIWLEELYLCRTNIKRIHRSYEEKQFFPRLQYLCLRETNITQENVCYFLTACPSLKLVNVNDCKNIDASWYHSLSNVFKAKVEYAEEYTFDHPYYNTKEYSCDHILKSEYFRK